MWSGSQSAHVAGFCHCCCFMIQVITGEVCPSCQGWLSPIQFHSTFLLRRHTSEVPLPGQCPVMLTLILGHHVTMPYAQLPFYWIYFSQALYLASLDFCTDRCSGINSPSVLCIKIEIFIKGEGFLVLFFIFANLEHFLASVLVRYICSV